MALRLEKLGYELERGKHGQPEIKGYTKEYLEASSPRREQIKDHLREQGIDGAAAAQIAAHHTRDRKELLSPEEVLQRHRELAAQHEHQADRVVAQAREHGQYHLREPEMQAKQAVDPRRQQGVSVFREEMRSFSVGDRIQFTAPANELKVANRELGTIEGIGQDGRLHLKWTVVARSNSIRASIRISTMAMP